MKTKHTKLTHNKAWYKEHIDKEIKSEEKVKAPKKNKKVKNECHMCGEDYGSGNICQNCGKNGQSEIPKLFYTEPKNINDMVFVTLTDEGVKVLQDHYKKYTSSMAPSEITGYKPEFQTLKTELWHLMQIFGARMYMGGKPMFLHNQIGFVINAF